jgi:hypothetical protein
MLHRIVTFYARETIKFKTQKRTLYLVVHFCIDLLLSDS